VKKARNARRAAADEAKQEASSVNSGRFFGRSTALGGVALVVGALVSQGCGSEHERAVAADIGQAPATDAGMSAADQMPDVFVPSTPEGGAVDASLGGDAAEAGPPSDAGADGAEGGVPYDGAIPTTCGPGTVMEPAGPRFCGNGWVDETESCDDGLGSTPAHRGCSAECQVLDELAVLAGPEDAGSTPTRTIGGGRHPLAVSDNMAALAYFEPESTPPMVSLTTFSVTGIATGVVNAIGVGSTVDEDSNPVLTALPCDKFVAAWTELDAPGGDELDIALRLVDPNVPPTGAPVFANVGTSFSQYDPDVLFSGSTLVVAWVDDTNVATAPDIYYRTFDAALNPTSGDLPLATTGDSEGDVVLAPFAGSWAAAWRDDSAGLETIEVFAGGATSTIGPAFLPGPVASKPAMTALDATHLLVVYTVGVEAGDSGVASDSQLAFAVVDTATPGVVVGQPLQGTVASVTGLSQSQPSVVMAGANAYVAWWTAAATGDVNGEQVWLKQVPVLGGAPMMTMPEVPLPRWPQAQLGDQRAPALATGVFFSGYSGAEVVAGWDDFGRQLGGGEWVQDSVVEFLPVPVTREPGDGGP
jgi:hypothetical protein